MSAFTSDLLDQADTLVRIDPRRPKQANLRRAVSSAYYALFHFLIEEAVLLVVGTAYSDKSLRQLIGRAFTHTAMKDVSSEMGKGTPRDLLKPFWLLYSIPTCASLQAVASAFVDLQNERHRADYDLSQPFTQREADSLVNRARSALADWELLKRNHPEVARFYALMLLHWNGLKAR